METISEIAVAAVPFVLGIIGYMLKRYFDFTVSASAQQSITKAVEAFVVRALAEGKTDQEAADAATGYVHAQMPGKIAKADSTESNIFEMALTRAKAAQAKEG